MIGISNRTIYAVAALYELGKLPMGKTRKIKEIALSASIPQSFLEQILLELKKSGILTSIKGAQGGYKLSKPLKEITLKEIIQTLETAPFTTAEGASKVLQLFWDDVKHSLKKSLDIPLSELIAYQQRVSQSLDYSI
jgi:Rrf2 family protein